MEGSGGRFSLPSSGSAAGYDMYHKHAPAVLMKVKASCCLNTRCSICHHNSGSGAEKMNICL